MEIMVGTIARSKKKLQKSERSRTFDNRQTNRLKVFLSSSHFYARNHHFELNFPLLCGQLITYSKRAEANQKDVSNKSDKKSPQFVGLGAPMCSQIFWPVNFNANQLNILVYLPLL